jgi:hypothetical protein
MSSLENPHEMTLYTDISRAESQELHESVAVSWIRSGREDKMHQVCCVCGIEYGVKPPDDDHITHGLCHRRLPVELRGIKKALAALKMLPTSPEQKNTYPVSAI